MNGQQYLILAYSAGLGLLVSYAAGLWVAARLGRRHADKAGVLPGAGGVL